MAKKRLVVYGRSVILGTVGASLQQSPTVEVIPLSPPLPPLTDVLALAPDVVVFDVEATPPTEAFPLLSSCPRLLLIGVNPTSDHVQLWSGSPMRAVSAQALIDVISQWSGSPPETGAGTRALAVL